MGMKRNRCENNSEMISGIPLMSVYDYSYSHATLCSISSTIILDNTKVTYLSCTIIIIGACVFLSEQMLQTAFPYGCKEVKNSS